MLVLGIETSCDETACAVVKNGGKILSNIVSSSLHLHGKYGGVVPEIATRYHVELINFVLARALNKAKVKLTDIDLVAVVRGPGLVGALLIGITMAKTLSLSLGVPLVGINHLQAHVYAALMNKPRAPFPFVAMVVSGGHTNLFYVRDYLRWRNLGHTRDDAAGEAFDKVAKILELGYPGGPVIEAMARGGSAQKVRFPRTYLTGDSLDFSFSGLKTAVLYYVRDRGITDTVCRKSKNTKISDKKDDISVDDVAAGFQEAVVDTLVDRADRACLLKKVKNFVVGGGVVANQRLKKALLSHFKKQAINVFFPEFALCRDNAAMVAALGYQLYRRGVVANLNLEARPNLI